MILDNILKSRKEQIEEDKRLYRYDNLVNRLRERTCEILDFKEAIDKPDTISLIAEIKLKTPSAGRLIKDEKEAIKIAKEYEKIEQIKAISVVAENKYFSGSLELVRNIKRNVNLPLLYKDFIIDECQIYTAYINGADAVLLIASFLSKSMLNKFIKISNKLNVTPVVEVHKEEDLKKINMNDIKIIAINNRNLYTFEVDITTTLRLKIHIPPNIIVISASGIKTKEDIELLKKKNIKVVLIGEALLRSEDIKAKVESLFS